MLCLLNLSLCVYEFKVIEKSILPWGSLSFSLIVKDLKEVRIMPRQRAYLYWRNMGNKSMVSSVKPDLVQEHCTFPYGEKQRHPSEVTQTHLLVTAATSTGGAERSIWIFKYCKIERFGTIQHIGAPVTLMYTIF